MGTEVDDGSVLLAASVLDRVLDATSALLGCELVAFNRLGDDVLLTARTAGSLPGLPTGTRTPRADAPCDRLLGGAAGATSALPEHAEYQGLPVVERLRLRTYAGAVVRDGTGEPVGTLCGFDRREVPVGPHQQQVLGELATVLTPHADGLRRLDAVVARGADGWHVQGSGDSSSALVALLSGEPLPDATDDEVGALRLTVRHLEGALQDRVLVEQALGVLAERHRVAPLEALVRLREHDAGGDLVLAARRVLGSAGRR